MTPSLKTKRIKNKTNILYMKLYFLLIQSTTFNENIQIETQIHQRILQKGL